jgi:predicted nucleic acid-binding protein
LNIDIIGTIGVILLAEKKGLIKDVLEKNLLPMNSIFTDKNKLPDNNDLKESLGDTYQLWHLIRDYVISK